VASLLCCENLAAQELFKYSVRAGPVWLDADNVKGDELMFGEIPLPGSSLGVEDEAHYGLILSWVFTPQFSLETAVSTPFNLDISAGGGVLGDRFRAGEIDVLPIVLIGRYTPDWSFLGIQPFIGLGATYVVFKNAKTTDKFDALAASLGVKDPSIQADNQLQPVLELGLDYSLSNRWFANVTWLYTDGNDEVSIAFSNNTTLISSVHYEANLFALTLGYRF
jgi:outer membrane protein